VTDDRRQHTRIAFHTPAKLTVGSETHAARVLDISLKGALLALNAATPIAIGSSCALEVALDEVGDVIRMEGEVRHVGGGDAGIVCRSIDLDSVTHLRRLVELNLGDPALLERELSMLAND